MNGNGHFLKDFEGKFHPKLAKSFDVLVEKYAKDGLSQEGEYLVLNKNCEKIHILKRPYITLEERGNIDIEDYIKELIEK